MVSLVGGIVEEEEKRTAKELANIEEDEWTPDLVCCAVRVSSGRWTVGRRAE